VPKALLLAKDDWDWHESVLPAITQIFAVDLTAERLRKVVDVDAAHTLVLAPS
jgi:hypothetical protein